MSEKTLDVMYFIRAKGSNLTLDGALLYVPLKYSKRNKYSSLSEKKYSFSESFRLEYGTQEIASCLIKIIFFVRGLEYPPFGFKRIFLRLQRKRISPRMRLHFLFAKNIDASRN